MDRSMAHCKTTLSGVLAVERLQYCSNPWQYPITFRVSARQGSMCFCPTKISGCPFYEFKGSKDPFPLKELMPLQYEGTQIWLGGSMLKIVRGPRVPK